VGEIQVQELTAKIAKNRFAKDAKKFQKRTDSTIFAHFAPVFATFAV